MPQGGFKRGDNYCDDWGKEHADEARRNPRLSREKAAELIQKYGEAQISPRQLQRLEGSDPVRSNILPEILYTYLLTPSEIEQVCADKSLLSLPGTNPHLVANERSKNLLVGEFGLVSLEAFRVGERLCAWIESEKASKGGGFAQDELKILLDAGELRAPAAYRQVALQLKRNNARRIKQGIRGWTDNPTFYLSSITSQLGDDAEERNQVTLHLGPSSYRFNVVAKQESGAQERWRALQAQDAMFPLQPVPHVASGVGVCINVICDGGRSVVLGQRSDDETFRKGEYDVAVVEGLRPSSDAIGGQVDPWQAAERALEEELGLSQAAELSGKGLSDVLGRIVLFEVGCDLEYYQWNILGFVEVNLDFETVVAGWRLAKDRKENQRLLKRPFQKQALIDTCSDQAIWSSGMACLLRTFDYYKRPNT